ncbi:MAG: ankyrin repeat domain-containing protein [Acholeplasmataceae bacterium]
MDLFKLALDNNLASLQSNLDSIGIKDSRGKSLLHHAVLGSANDVIDFLLNQDIDVNITDQSGETSLFDCARKGKVKIATKLITKYANINLKNNRGETILHLAAHKGDFDFVKLLVENGANLNEKTQSDRLPVHYAILAGHVHLINYLMETSNQSWFYLDENQNSFLHYAAKTTNPEMVKLFLNNDLDPNGLNSQFETPLFNAVRQGTKETVLELLKKDSFINLINRRYEGPIVLAKINDQKEILDLLKDWVKRPEYLELLNAQSLTIAVLNRDYSGLKQLLEQGKRLKKDRLKQTAYDYANKYKLQVCVNLLRPYN